MQKTILVLTFLLALTNAKSQNTYRSYFKDQTAYREHPLDIKKMSVEVNFEPEKGLVIGKVAHQAMVLQKQVDSVFFDAPGITIKKATLNGNPTNYNTTAKGVWVKPSQPLKWDNEITIAFEYEATPKKGIYFIGWNVPENNLQNPFAIRKQIWTQGQGVDNRYWIPMYDDMNDKFITETTITFKNGYEVLSNGKLIKKTSNKNNTTTWHYAMSKPHAGYLLMLGIGKYAINQTKSKSGVPMLQYYYPEYKERLAPTYRYSEEMMAFLETETGVKYPWDGYAQIMVQDFIYGAMENTTATIFGDFFFVDERAYLDRNYVGVNCHELTHQWFGDLITARDGRDTWLQESWATFYPKMLTKNLLGVDAYNWQRRAEQNTAIEASKKDKLPIRNAAAGTPRVYQKGSAVISMLNYVLGEEEYKRVINAYLKNHAYGNVETNDLVQTIQDVLGKDLSWFFDEWVYRGGEPEFTVHYEDLLDKNGNRSTEIAIEQTHQRDETVGLFTMPIIVEVHYEDGTFDRETEWVNEQFEVVKIANKNKKNIRFVLFDPNGMVIKTVKFKKSLDELSAQLKYAQNMLDKYDALVALKDYPINQKKNLLLEVFSKETFHALHSEIINQLISDEDASVKMVSVFNGNVPQPKISYIKTYQALNPNCIAAIEKCLTDSSYDVVQSALEKLCKLKPGQAQAYLSKVENVYGMNNVVNIKYHELSVIYLTNNKQNAEALVNYASNVWEFRTRIAAFAAIKSAGVFSDALIPHLFDAMLSNNSRLAAPAADLATYLCANSPKLMAMQNWYNAQSYNTQQKETIKKYLPNL